MTMSDKMRRTLFKRGVSAAAAACLFAIVQGCATQPTQSQASSGYAPPESSPADSGAAGSTSGDHGRTAKHGHHHKTNPYFRTTTSSSAGSVTVEGNTIHYHAVAGLLIVHPKGWNDAERNAGDPPASPRAHEEHRQKPA